MKTRKYHSYEKIHHNYEILSFVYIILSTLFAVCLFLYGFFPVIHHNTLKSTPKDIPRSINNIKINPDRLYKPYIQKVIVMIIDALRWDFVDKAHETGAMPLTSGLIANKSACVLQVKVNTPTVTMPRIKAMTTGVVSSFIDVAFNFGKSVVSSDNILLQAKNHGHKLIFYGDDTWLKLYPDIFMRSEGTTSFFVTDYTEVDNNVTRHINDELNENNDWSIMILHYLGLDHIGHLYGPQSSLVMPKLQEMDQIIGQIANRINQWNEKDVPSMLIICGDHGMKDSGGHGGSTPEETLVPLVAYGVNCLPSSSSSSSSSLSDYNKIDQIDIATTLAMMLGLPLPASNLGSVSINMIDNLPLENKLFMLHYNAKQVLEHFKQLSEYKSYRCYFDYLNAIKLYSEWLNGSLQSVGQMAHTKDLYYNALKEMKNILMKNMIHYNIAVMNAAVILMIQALLLIINFNTSDSFSLSNFLHWLTSGTFLWFTLNQILYHGSNDIIKINNYQLTILMLVFFTINCYLCGKIPWKSIISTKDKKLNSIYFLSMIIYVISLGSSSFVEEEHQTWYYFWSTFLLLEVTKYISHFYSLNMRSFNNHNMNTMNTIIKVVFLLIQHRILRKFNNTGNKYTYLPDISGWIKNQESYTTMTLTLLIALGLLFIIGYILEYKNYDVVILIINTIMTICVYKRHAHENSVIDLSFSSKSRSVNEVQIFWIALSVFTVYSLWKIIYTRSKNNRSLLNNLLVLITKIWVLISALLHRPYNVILLPMQLITHLIINNIFYKYITTNNTNFNEEILMYISYCLGNVYYFYQGNSNSLATIDVAAGYVGLESYNFYITTLFLCINTFSAPILSYLILLCYISRGENHIIDNSKLLCANRKYTTFIIFSITVYTIIITIERYHLFVWTVFSPKLLYNAVHCGVFFTVMTFIQILDVTIKKINEFNY